MQAILFPMTYISEAVCEAVRTCFQRVRIYQPTRRQVPPQLQAASQKGLVDISIPAEYDDKKIETLVRDYRKWAELHQGGVRDYLKRQKDSPPFFDDTATARIRAEIKQIDGNTGSDDPLLNARLFLQIAQEYDLQSEEVSRKLVAMNQVERKLFMNITGEPDVPTQNVFRQQSMEEISTAGHMMLPRILAWARLFLQDAPSSQTQAPTAFVTIHREAIDFLMEGAPAAEPIFKVSSVPVIKPSSPGYDDWQKRFSRIIDALPGNAGEMAAELAAGLPDMNPSHPNVNLTIYRIAGESPPVFFARCVGRALSQEIRMNGSGGQPHTLLGQVEMG